MASKNAIKHSVTLPDGTTATRTSETRSYSHVLVVTGTQATVDAARRVLDAAEAKVRPGDQESFEAAEAVIAECQAAENARRERATADGLKGMDHFRAIYDSSEALADKARRSDAYKACDCYKTTWGKVLHARSRLSQAEGSLGKSGAVSWHGSLRTASAAVGQHRKYRPLDDFQILPAIQD
jgi:hypothetical protein